MRPAKHLYLFCNLFNKFFNTRAQMLDSIYLSYDIKITLKSHFRRKYVMYTTLVSGLSHPFLGMGPGPMELGKLAAF